MQNTDDVIEIDLKEIFGVLINKIWLIAICGIVAGGNRILLQQLLYHPPVPVHYQSVHSEQAER